MERVHGYTRVLATGAPILPPDVSVRVVLTGTDTDATIFSDNLNPPTALANPFTPDAASGRWEFLAANGRYDVIVYGDGVATPYTEGDLLLYDPDDA